MAKRICGFVLVALSLLTAFLGFKIVAGSPGNQEVIENAVYVSDGKVFAENEGKVVIATGTLEAKLPFTDEETGVLLHSIVTYRRVEKVGTRYDSQRKKYYWDWSSTVSENDFGGSKKLIAPGVTLGEFSVAEELLMSISATRSRTSYDKKELNQRSWKKYKDNGKVYLYQGDWVPYDDEFAGRDEAYTGALRVAYDEMSDSDTLEYTVIGRQQEGKLVKVEELDFVAAHSGHLTAEELLKEEKSGTTTSVVTAFCIAVVLLGVGIFLIVKSGKNMR